MKIRIILSILICSLIMFSSIKMTSAEKTDIIESRIKLNENCIPELMSQLDQDIVYEYHNNLMQYAPRYTGSDNCHLAGNYIFGEFQKIGLPVEFHNWKFGGFESRNVVATLDGANKEGDAEIIICAHYDTVDGAPGANDDGSGIAVLLAIANVTSKYSFNHTLRFIAFSGEEIGAYGSFTYAKKAYEREDNIYAVLNIDIVGFADSAYGGKILRFYAQSRSEWISRFANEVGEKYRSFTDMWVEELPDYRGADNQAFEDYGYDGVWIGEHDGYQWCHTPEDKIERINFTYETKVAKFMLAVAAEMATRPINVQVIIKHPKEGQAHFFNKSIFETAFGRFFFKPIRGTTILFGRPDVNVEVKSTKDIKFVIFCIDDNFIKWDSSPPYNWKIEGKYSRLIGRYTLRVYAYTMSGEFAFDEMDIIIFSRAYQYSKW